MFAGHHKLKSIAARKRLLVAESELNRAQLAADLHALNSGIHAVTRRASAFTSLTARSAEITTGLAALLMRKASKPTRTQVVLKGAGVFIAICTAILDCRRKSGK